MREWIARVIDWFRRDRLEAELAEELQFHPLPDASGESFVLDAVSYTGSEDLARWTTSFERTAIFSYGPLAVGVGQDAHELPVGAASASFFGFFDAPPALGRYFTVPEDQPPGGSPVVVLSYGTWQNRYAGRPDALGATLQIGPTVYTVIGVAPRGFVGLWEDQPPVAFVPFSAWAAGVYGPRGKENWWSSPTWNAASMLVRRKPGVTVGAASSDLTSALLRNWKAPPPLTPHAIAASVLSERGPNQTSAGKVAALVGAMALIVLLIAGANVANLLLARALRRRREIAVRLAIGVSRGRLLSQLLAESVLLASLGGLAGLAVAEWGGSALRAAFLPPGVDSPVVSDTRTLIFVGIAVLAAGVLTGLAPAWQANRADLTRDLKIGARDAGTHRSPARVVLLVLQAALSVLLLVGAGLFVRSLTNVRQLDLGYDVDPIVVVNLNMRGISLDSARTVALRERLLAAVRRVPSVERAALNATLPLWSRRFGGEIRVPGIDPPALRRLPDIYVNVVTPEYFATMGTRIVRGRGFDARDVAGAPGALVVSTSLARALWPGKDAIGQCVILSKGAPCAYVVGVAEDIRNTALSGDPGLYYYRSAAQSNSREMGLVVRVRGNAAQQVEVVRQALQKEMPGASYVKVSPFAHFVGSSMKSWRLGATMFVVFGGLALVLAAIGLYGVVAYDVAQRTREIGVRRALGAQSGNVVRLVLRQGVMLGGLGIAIGATITLAAAGRVAPLLFGVSPRDPAVYAFVAAAMLVVALAASVIPARRAASVDPNVALRSE